MRHCRCVHIQCESGPVDALYQKEKFRDGARDLDKEVGLPSCGDIPIYWEEIVITDLTLVTFWMVPQQEKRQMALWHNDWGSGTLIVPQLLHWVSFDRSLDLKISRRQGTTANVPTAGVQWHAGQMLSMDLEQSNTVFSPNTYASKLSQIVCTVAIARSPLSNFPSTKAQP